MLVYDDNPYDALAELPEEPYERALGLMNALADFATGAHHFGDSYVQIRKELLADPSIRHLLPEMVTKCRDVGALWSYAKALSPQYEPRRQLIRASFEPLLEYLEARASPAEDLIRSACLL